MLSRSIILAVSDLQIPFEHQDALDFCLHVKKTFCRALDKFTCVNIGDEVDQHTLGKYAADPNGRSASDELHEARMQLKPWFKAFPRTYICESNHTYRIYKKAFNTGIPSEFLRSIKDVYEAPDGWQWKEEWIFDDILFEHGENVSGQTAAMRAALDNRMSTVIGHQHTWGGVQYSNSKFNQIWGMNVGCLIDVDKYAFKYGKKLRKKPTLGCGIVVDGVPLYLPMVLNQQKRWIKRLI